MSATNRPLKLFSGDGFWCVPDDDLRFAGYAIQRQHGRAPRAYVAAHSLEDARRVIEEFSGRLPPKSEIANHWMPSWDEAMSGVEPERGLWVHIHTDRAPDRMLVSEKIQNTQPPRPVLFCAGAASEGHFYAFADYAGRSEDEVLHKLMTVARREGFRGTAEERLKALGWVVRPLFDNAGGAKT